MCIRTGQIIPEHPRITGTEAGSKAEEDFLKIGANSE